MDPGSLGPGADPCAGHLLHGEQRRLDVARVEVQAPVGEIPREVLDALRVERRGGVGDGRQREKSLFEPATQRSVGAKCNSEPPKVIAAPFNDGSNEPGI